MCHILVRPLRPDGADAVSPETERRLWREFSRRIFTMLRERHYFVRLSRDLFAVIVQDPDTNLTSLVEALHDRATRPYHLDGQVVGVECVLGATTGAPRTTRHDLDGDLMAAVRWASLQSRQLIVCEPMPGPEPVAALDEGLLEKQASAALYEPLVRLTDNRIVGALLHTDTTTADDLGRSLRLAIHEAFTVGGLLHFDGEAFIIGVAVPAQRLIDDPTILSTLPPHVPLTGKVGLIIVGELNFAAYRTLCRIPRSVIPAIHRTPHAIDQQTDRQARALRLDLVVGPVDTVEQAANLPPLSTAYCHGEYFGGPMRLDEIRHLIQSKMNEPG